MKLIPIITALLFTSIIAYAQNGFTTVRYVKDMKVEVKAVNNMIVLIPNANPNERYIAENMPEELKSNGLQMSISGDIGKIPSNARMMGTPFKLACVTITKTMQSKYKLKKRKWTFK